LSKKSLENRGDSSDDFSIHPILELLRGEPSAGKGADDVFTPPSFESSDLV